MPLKIISADERLSRPHKVNIALFGPSGIGKTTQARSLPEKTTLVMDLEAGDLALGNWRGDTIDIRKQAAEMGIHPWMLARALACILSGPDPAAGSDSPYSQAAYNEYVAALGGPEQFDKYEIIFWDSITVAARHSFSWSQTQPEAFSEKTGKPDNRGAYGKHGIEMVRWLTTIQHIPNKSTIVVGILDKEVDDMRRTIYSPQIEGSKAGRELPGIFDEVLTLDVFKTEDGQEYRAFVCNMMNPWGYPAKDRSGCLEMMEPPDLGALIKKIQGGVRHDGQLVSTIPASQPANAAAIPPQQDTAAKTAA